MVAATIATHAQEEPEFRMELGAGIGLVNYVGDFNSSLVKNMQPWASLLAKYRLNPRMALALNVYPSRPLSSPLLLPSNFPSIRVFSNELALHIMWSKY